MRVLDVLTGGPARSPGYPESGLTERQAEMAILLNAKEQSRLAGDTYGRGRGPALSISMTTSLAFSVAADACAHVGAPLVSLNGIQGGQEM